MYISIGAVNIFIKTNPFVIPFCTKLGLCIFNRYVESDHDRVGFDEDITCAGGDIPIVGIIFNRGDIGTFTKFLEREGNLWFSLYLE